MEANVIRVIKSYAKVISTMDLKLCDTATSQNHRNVIPKRTDQEIKVEELETMLVWPRDFSQNCQCSF